MSRAKPTTEAADYELHHLRSTALCCAAEAAVSPPGGLVLPPGALTVDQRSLHVAWKDPEIFCIECDSSHKTECLQRPILH